MSDMLQVSVYKAIKHAQRETGTQNVSGTPSGRWTFDITKLGQMGFRGQTM